MLSIVFSCSFQQKQKYQQQFNNILIAYMVLASPLGFNVHYDYCWGAWYRFAQEHHDSLVVLLLAHESEKEEGRIFFPSTRTIS